MPLDWNIHPEINQSSTLPGRFYHNPETFEELKEKVFVKSWHWVGDKSLIPFSKYCYPFILLEDYLHEPLVITRDENDQLHCVSNVCTHRGNLVVGNGGKNSKLTCLYHGRRFDLDGKFEFMPEFKEAKDFPQACDNLPQFSLFDWHNHLFVSLEPAIDFDAITAKMEERIGFLPVNNFKFSASRSKEYLVNAHWALYCDNYLEGFHIPYVHNDLNATLDYGSYATEIYDFLNLQIGYADNPADCFKLPSNHPDYGKNVAAYYYWIFPNMMFNFYPWGLSINVVKPQTVNRTKVAFLTYVYDDSKLDSGAGALLDKVEREDEFVVEGVHKGLKSRYYKRGRFSPTREKGVHQFHGLIAQILNKGWDR